MIDLEKYVLESYNSGRVKSVSELTDEDDWSEEITDSLIEQLFENVSTAELSEGLKFDYDKMSAGDIFLVKSFDTDKTTVDNKEHRVLLVTSIPANKRENSEYFGFSFTSNINQASENSGRKKRVLIDNYETILESGEASSKSVVINLEEVVKFKPADLAHGDRSYLGHASEAFMKFIKAVMTGKEKDTQHWNEEMAKKYK